MLNTIFKRRSEYIGVCLEVPDLALYDNCCIYEKHTIVCLLVAVCHIRPLHSQNILSYDFVFPFQLDALYRKYALVDLISYSFLRLIKFTGWHKTLLC